MASALISEPRSPASSPFQGHSVVFFEKTFMFTLIVPLSIQVYKWVLTNLMLGVTIQWSSVLSREDWKYSLSLEPEIRMGGPLVCYADLLIRNRQ